MFEGIIRCGCDRWMSHSIFHIQIIVLANPLNELILTQSMRKLTRNARSSLRHWKTRSFYLRDEKKSNTNCFGKFWWTFSWSRFSTVGFECCLFFSSCMIKSKSNGIWHEKSIIHGKWKVRRNHFLPFDIYTRRLSISSCFSFNLNENKMEFLYGSSK